MTAIFQLQKLYDYTNGFENCGVSLGDLSESDLARTLDDKRPAGSILQKGPPSPSNIF